MVWETSVRVDGVLQPLLFGGAQNAVELLGLPRPSIVVEGPMLLPNASRRRRDRRLQQSSLLLLKDNDGNDSDDDSVSSVSVLSGGVRFVAGPTYQLLLQTCGDVGREGAILLSPQGQS